MTVASARDRALPPSGADQSMNTSSSVGAIGARADDADAARSQRAREFDDRRRVPAVSDAHVQRDRRTAARPRRRDRGAAPRARAAAPRPRPRRAAPSQRRLQRATARRARAAGPRAAATTRRAPLGFVQIRRRHHDRQALRQELGQQLPELATRHRIDARRRLVEHEHGGSCTSVHASASFCFMPPDSRSARRSRNGVSPVSVEQPLARRAAKSAHAMDAREELDVLVDREIAVQAELLRHVADRGGRRAVRAERIGAEHADGAASAAADRRSAAAPSSCRRRPGR